MNKIVIFLLALGIILLVACTTPATQPPPPVITVVVTQLVTQEVPPPPTPTPQPTVELEPQLPGLWQMYQDFFKAAKYVDLTHPFEPV